MGVRLQAIKLFTSALVSGLASGVLSSTVNLRFDVERLEGLLFITSSTTSTGDVSFEYAISPNSAVFGSFADEAAILTSTFSLTNPVGWHTVALPNVLAPYVQFRVSGTGSNPTDTRVTAELLLRMT